MLKRLRYAMDLRTPSQEMYAAVGEYQKIIDSVEMARMKYLKLRLNPVDEEAMLRGIERIIERFRAIKRREAKILPTIVAGLNKMAIQEQEREGAGMLNCYFL